jgi:hypothetical protein
MEGLRRKSQRAVLLVVLALCGFLSVGVFAGVGFAGGSTSTEPPPTTTVPEDQKCNSGRGNGSEGDDSQLLTPGVDTGPGVAPTVDCDPGNSGGQNRGGD